MQSMQINNAKNNGKLEKKQFQKILVYLYLLRIQCAGDKSEQNKRTHTYIHTKVRKKSTNVFNLQFLQLLFGR